MKTRDEIMNKLRRKANRDRMFTINELAKSLKRSYLHVRLTVYKLLDENEIIRELDNRKNNRYVYGITPPPGPLFFEIPEELEIPDAVVEWILNRTLRTSFEKFIQESKPRKL